MKKYELTEHDKKFLAEAKFKAEQWSKDPSSKIAALAISPTRRVLATGYNGFPRKIADTPERLNNREEKYKYVVHAEQNLIYNSSFEGVSLADSTLYVYGLPVCSECAKGIIQVGVNKVIALQRKNINNPLWTQSNKLTEELFSEAGIEYILLTDD